MGSSTNRKAIVIGGSIAGLAASQVLSQHFDQVTLIERDHYPDSAEYRKGIPQERQPHLFLIRGLRTLDELFPGFIQEYRDAGAVPVDFGQQVDWFVFGGWRPHYDQGAVSYSASRPVLEHILHHRIAANSKIRLVQDTEVIDLIGNAAQNAITGVRARSRSGQQAETIYEADLIVDTTGRASQAQDWLQQLGYACPERTIVNAFAGYASRIYERPAAFTSEMIYIQPTPPHEKQGAIMFPLEGNRVHVALIGMAKAYPSTDEAAFLPFLEALPDKRLYNLLKDAKPLTPISGYRAHNVRYYYERLTRVPENFVLLGDSVVAFNPVYGQGMTIAVLSAQKLGECLKAQFTQSDSLTGLAAKFQKEIGKIQDFAWQLATGEDMRWSAETEGYPAKPGMAESFRLNFLYAVMKASTKDAVITKALYDVMNMTATPAVFFRPGMLARIIRAS